MHYNFKVDDLKHIETILYPDGQRSLIVDTAYFNEPKKRLALKARVRNFAELELFSCFVSALRHIGYACRHVEFVYLFGMRSDRVFAPGQPNYFRDVVAPYINAMGFKHITLYEPHGNNAADYLDGDIQLVYPLTDHIFFPGKELMFGADESVIFADHHFHKERTETGVKVSLNKEARFKIENAHRSSAIHIVDDLADGGATFLAIANYLQVHFPKLERHLYITHGLFTKGLHDLAAKYAQIVTTNTYQDFPQHKDDPLKIPNNVEVVNVWTSS